MRQAATLLIAAMVVAVLAGCVRKAPETTAADVAADAGGPLEKRPRNATEFEPMFPDQTRAPAAPSHINLDVQVIAKDLVLPWAVEQLPDGRFLVTEKPGQLRIVSPEGKISAPVAGMPAVRFNGQAGLLDVALDPAYADNHVIYFCYSEQREGGSGIALARARLVEEGQAAHLEDLKVIFRETPTIDSDRQLGSRIAFGKDGKLFLTLGERGITEAVGQAQDLRSGFGKLARLNADGSIPKDNPFVGRSDALPEIWSYGHRDAQSLAVDAVTGKVWSIEHGPRGGDELNLIVRGANYGWPVICYGIDYSGAKVGQGITRKEGMEQPVYYWDPVIAPSGMVVYRGAMFPEWQGSIFVGGLVGMKLVRLQMEGDRVKGEEWLLQDIGARVRDVQQGVDGALYVLTERGSDSTLVRIARQAGS